MAGKRSGAEALKKKSTTESNESVETAAATEAQSNQEQGQDVTSATAVKTAESADELQPIEDLALVKRVQVWELAGLMRAIGWADGKQVTEAEFDKALEAFRNRPQGGGRIAL